VDSCNSVTGQSQAAKGFFLFSRISTLMATAPPSRSLLHLTPVLQTERKWEAKRGLWKREQNNLGFGNSSLHHQPWRIVSPGLSLGIPHAPIRYPVAPSRIEFGPYRALSGYTLWGEGRISAPRLSTINPSTINNPPHSFKTQTPESQ
jgi:hypothetical protein